jgi:hypothetical protein
MFCCSGRESLFPVDDTLEAAVNESCVDVEFWPLPLQLKRNITSGRPSRIFEYFIRIGAKILNATLNLNNL